MDNSLEDQRNIFSYRTRMNPLKYNYSENQQVSEKCRCGIEMTNIHLYECENLNSSIKKVPYTKLFSGRICELKY